LHGITVYGFAAYPGNEPPTAATARISVIVFRKWFRDKMFIHVPPHSSETAIKSHAKAQSRKEKGGGMTPFPSAFCGFA